MEIGRGSRRVCMRIPGTDLCLKRYRDDDEVGASVRREIASSRFDRRRNTCAQEYDYFQSLKTRLSPETLSVFPERLELRHDDKYGWHLVESLVLNGDGSVPEKFTKAYRGASAAQQVRLYAEFCSLMRTFEEAAVRFYDPQNVIVQWPGKPFEGSEFRLRIVDFEPVSRNLVPIDMLAPVFCRMKLRRRVRRYVKEKLHRKHHPLSWSERHAWDDCIAKAGAGMGLSACRAFLENKPVNDIFYEGLFNGRPCIVKCSSKAPGSMANEYALSRKMHDVDPLTCSEPFAHWESPDGRRAFVVTERLQGPSLTELRKSDASVIAGKADGVAADFVRIANALEKARVIHRDMGTTDNYLMGADGHIRLIDFQFAIDRDTGCRDAWLERHPRYHFVVFSGKMDSSGCTWNDVRYLVSHIKAYLPSSPAVEKAAGVLERMAQRAWFRHDFSLHERLSLIIHRWSLRLQLAFRPGNGPKANSIRYRLSRLDNAFRAEGGCA